ncbi:MULTISPECIES: acyl-CoA thioesterase domain-containing protein [unclassified Streptomyces]|uniref:acyl-CoA thioesterase n=1 Tax=unclassified Streptomyces TaxID=2593676 RepID=UPI002E81E9B9|nr:acyl-CoA thioesterase domain-containing protein [Streptomyces sp. NBC_00589]WTI35631.1 thioesterase family protein [Streptomyces sp. NBC_00775]WUB30696.1 thioesterase family protein [Streptomyces sp. NBC_00589]
MTDLWSDLLGCLGLRAEPGDATKSGGAAKPGAAAEPGDVFEGRNQQLSYHRLFGGQLLAQFVRAASLTCPGKTVKSLHAAFPRAGRTEEPVRYEVVRHHEGGTFATLTVIARQRQGVVATASVSLHAHEDGLERQTTAPVPSVPGAEHRVTLDLLPWETRAVAELDSPKSEPPEYDLWMRTPTVSAELAPALIAYATDLSLIGTALRPLEGISQHDAGTAFSSAVTSHSLWFHRPFRTDDWLLLHQHSPLLAHGRCFGRGDVFTEDGSLVASYAQEALLRFRPAGG